MAQTAHRHRTLYASSLLTISSFSCSGKCTPAGKLERSSQAAVVLPRRGMFVREMGSSRHLGAPGHILFFEPGGSYRVEHPNHAGDECTIFSVPIDTLATLAQSHGLSFRDNGSHLFHQLSCLSSKDIHILHGDLLRALLREQGDSGCVEDLALCLIGKAVLLSRQAERSISSQRESTRRANADSVQAAMIFMHMQMHRRVTLADVARAAHVSPYHLCRIFRRHTGLSVHAYLNRIRLRSALFDLDIGAPNLTEVALNHGFDSHAHFSSSFKRQFGTPPASYRSARSQR